jgi:hypothetical protein
MRYELTDFEMECHQADVADVAEQAARRAARGRPTCSQRDLLGAAIRCAVARYAWELWPLHDLLQLFRSLATGWFWEWVEAWDNVASGSWIRCRLDKDICWRAWRVGQHSAKMESQGAYLFQSSPLPRS